MGVTSSDVRYSANIAWVWANNPLKPYHHHHHRTVHAIPCIGISSPWLTILVQVRKCHHMAYVAHKHSIMWHIQYNEMQKHLKNSKTNKTIQNIKTKSMFFFEVQPSCRIYKAAVDAEQRPPRENCQHKRYPCCVLPQ